MNECSKCQGTRWKTVEIDGVERLVPCDCRLEARATEEAAHPGGFIRAGEIARISVPAAEEITPSDGIRYAAGRAASLEHPDREVAAIILDHRGENHPVTIAEISAMLWPGEPTKEREIKKIVARLSDPQGPARLLIASSRRADSPGYYLITNQEELDRARAHTLQHLIAWARRLRAFKPSRQECEEIYGQLRAEFEGEEKEAR
jgi:hypothetical protein